MCDILIAVYCTFESYCDTRVNIMSQWCVQGHLQCVRSSLRTSEACPRAPCFNAHRRIRYGQAMIHADGRSGHRPFAKRVPSSMSLAHLLEHKQEGLGASIRYIQKSTLH